MEDERVEWTIIYRSIVTSGRAYRGRRKKEFIWVQGKRALENSKQ
jgi:hypothetical protein